MSWLRRRTARPVEIRVTVKDEPHGGGTATEAGAVLGEGGWLADGPEQEPETTPLRKPEKLPEGVIGYTVALRGESRDNLADSDLRKTLEDARADARRIGKRPGWAGRAVVCEVREVPR